MPRYDRHCLRCGFTKEVNEQRDDDGPVWCSGCRYGVMRRLPSAVPAIYKTGGFYSTSHRKGGDSQ